MFWQPARHSPPKTALRRNEPVIPGIASTLLTLAARLHCPQPMQGAGQASQASQPASSQLVLSEGLVLAFEVWDVHGRPLRAAGHH